MAPLLLRAALKRGFLLIAANWPVILIEFAVESFYKLALALPVIGGALMVGALLDADVAAIVSQGVAATADLVLGSLSTAPAALAAFLGALAIVAIGGEAMMFIVKAGTLAVIVDADRRAGEDVHRLPIGLDSVARSRAFSLVTLVAAARHFAGRMCRLALVLGAVYLALGLSYFAVVTIGVTRGGSVAWLPAWSLVVLLSTSAGVVALAIVNLACDLIRVVVITDDCGLREAVRRVRRFVIEDARQVIGIFSVIGGVEVVAAAASITAAAGLAPIAYLPIASLVVVPLQLAVWILRGLLFELLSLSSLAAYQTQYRRFASASGASQPT